PAAAGCIDCHMPKKLGMHPVTKMFGSPDRPDPREHGFVGGNRFGILAVEHANPARYMAYQSAFDLAEQPTIESIAAAVKVTLTSSPPKASAGNSVDLTVHVETLPGHKSPTGYAESRRAWIAIVLVDAKMNEQSLLGAYDPATGDIAAAPPT